MEIAAGKGSHGCDRSTHRPVDVTLNCAQCVERDNRQRCCAQRRRQTSTTSTNDAGTSHVVDRVQQGILSHKRCVPGKEIVAPIPGFTVDAAVCRPETGGRRSSLFDWRSQEEEEKDQRHRPTKELRQAVIVFVIPAIAPPGPLCCTSGSLSRKGRKQGHSAGLPFLLFFLQPSRLPRTSSLSLASSKGFPQEGASCFWDGVGSGPPGLGSRLSWTSIP